jgi:hypothetical protein
VIVLTAMEAAYRCPSGAILKFYRRTKPALTTEVANVAPAAIAKAGNECGTNVGVR